MPDADDLCLVPDCHQPEEAGGLCAGHRWRKKRGLSMSKPLREIDLSPYERVLEAIKEMEFYDGADREHEWKCRLRAAVRAWVLPKRIRKSRRRTVQPRRRVKV